MWAPIGRALMMAALATVQGLTLSCGSREQADVTEGAEVLETKQAEDDQQCGACTLAPFLAVAHPVPKCTLTFPKRGQRVLTEYELLNAVGARCTEELGTGEVLGAITPAIRESLAAAAEALETFRDAGYDLDESDSLSDAQWWISYLRRDLDLAEVDGVVDYARYFQDIFTFREAVLGLVPVTGGLTKPFLMHRGLVARRACQAATAVAAALAAALAAATAA